MVSTSNQWFPLQWPQAQGPDDDLASGSSGSTLTEYNIVREWRKIGEWNGEAVGIALNLTPESDEYDACAVLVQEAGYGPIRGAASFRMEKPAGG